VRFGSGPTPRYPGTAVAGGARAVSP
jgi:hypothetical protein